ncbi:MAG: glycosyl hydrolase [Fimbriimonadaceae bacterium]
MIIALALCTTFSNPVKDTLLATFQNPPASAKPHTWWHWMDGNVTKEGITADLKAMKEVGIGGAQMFTVSQEIPKGPVDYMSPLWREMTVHAVKEAQRFGIELCLHNCAGWSSSGGPWVKPEYAMQVLAWSETAVKGPSVYSGVLPLPKAPQVYANVPYYKDVAVYAFQNSKPAKGPNFLGETGVNRQDGLVVDPKTSAAESVGRRDLILLTGKMDATGNLNWDVPPGDWTILRLGHVPTGKNNHPAPPEGDGLEVDKLSREALDEFWKGTMATVIKDVGPLAGKVLNNALVDSYEVGSQNWTPKMLAEFKKRRGYDALLYLPAIAGYTVDNRQTTERFLWDWRRTIADLYHDNYYKYFGELCHKAGLLFSTEPYGNGGFDNIQAGGTADIPMGEFWIGGGTLETTKIAASTGHVYGRPVIGAESFTADEGRGKWLEEPYTAKALGDFVFCNGVNRYIFHRYAQQPWMDKFPGMTMGPWGTHLERTQTWWTEARAWMKYIARCQALLQSGKFVADALYYYGEDAPADLPYGPSLKPKLPAGYDYDGCDASVVMNRLSVKNGELILPDGMKYSFLVLPERKTMTFKMITRLEQLVKAGATIVGPKPETTPSLAEYPAYVNPLKVRADALWGKGPGVHRYGKGQVIWGKNLEAVLANLKIAPDFAFRTASSRAKMAYIHRRIGGAEVYFVSNQTYKAMNVDCTFRVKGLAPELWHADSGKAEAAPIYRMEEGRTTVPLHLGPAESVFVVFRAGKVMPHLKSMDSGVTALAPQRKPKIAIKSARYETADGRGKDVTELVSGMIRSGQYEIEATNVNFGDPVVNTVKRLVIEYTLDGADYKKTVAENETLVVWEAPGSPSAPKTFTVKSTAAGLEVTPWKAGTLTGWNSKGKLVQILAKVGPKTLDLSHDWDVKFPPNWGAPPSIHLDDLTSWAEHSDEGVKYFSGSANYGKEVFVPSGFVGKGKTVLLELGRVKNFATVSLNGVQLEVLWKEPFTVDVSKALKPGRNRLDIKVTNLWPNRIIGDEQLPPDVEWEGAHLKRWPDWLVKGEPRPKTGRYTFTTWRYWNKDSTLLESGLLGPVVIRSAAGILIK